MASAPDTYLEILKKARRGLQTFAVAAEVMAEVAAQDAKWGEQHHRDGTGRGYGEDVLRDLDRHGASSGPTLADVAKARADHYAGINGGDALEWEQILTEEFFEALEEGDPQALRAKLIQVAAVALNWVTDIDSREPADVDEEPYIDYKIPDGTTVEINPEEN